MNGHRSYRWRPPTEEERRTGIWNCRPGSLPGGRNLGGQGGIWEPETDEERESREAAARAANEADVWSALKD
jgi:hypothetical protein